MNGEVKFLRKKKYIYIYIYIYIYFFFFFGGGGGVGVGSEEGGHGRCEQRSEVFVIIQKIVVFFWGGVELGGGSGLM